MTSAGYTLMGKEEGIGEGGIRVTFWSMWKVMLSKAPERKTFSVHYTGRKYYCPKKIVNQLVTLGFVFHHRNFPTGIYMYTLWHTIEICAKKNLPRADPKAKIMYFSIELQRIYTKMHWNRYHNKTCRAMCVQGFTFRSTSCIRIYTLKMFWKLYISYQF